MRYKDIAEDRGGKKPETPEERLTRLRAKVTELGYAQYGEGPNAEEILSRIDAPGARIMVLTNKNRKHLRAFLLGDDNAK